MSHKRKGLVATSKEWAKHLRAYNKRLFWKQHRKAEKAITVRQSSTKED
jgi:hypothetical protein